MNPLITELAAKAIIRDRLEKAVRAQGRTALEVEGVSAGRRPHRSKTTRLGLANRLGLSDAS